MRILVDVGHPAHVHLFRNAIRIWQERGHQIVVTARDKDITTCLLAIYGLDYHIASRRHRGTIGLLIELLERDWRMLQIARRCKSDLLLGSSVSISHVSRIISARSIVFGEDDAQSARMFTRLTYPFADVIVTPAVLPDDFGEKHVRYEGYHELAYLHPNRFMPNPSVLSRLGVEPGEPYYIMRFVSLQAVHDRGESGLSLAMRRKLIRALSKLGRVCITSEAPLPEEFDPYRTCISPADMHDALYYATMFIGDSQTMTIEAAVLGTPAIRCNTFVGRCSVIEELECKYGLTYGFLPGDEDQMFDKILDLLDDENLHDRWQQRRKRMLEDKIDLTAWMVDFIENYPDSWYRYRKA